MSRISTEAGTGRRAPEPGRRGSGPARATSARRPAVSWETLREGLRDLDAELGADAYLVGGLVRDRVLGRVAKDVDVVVVSVAPGLLLGRLATRLGWPPPVVFERFATAHIAGDGWEVEAVRARAEAYTPQSRTPDVRPGTLLDDVMRRDFTVDALCERLADGELLDLTGYGLDDLRQGLLRTPLDPALTLAEDPLRVLRAGRLAATHGLQPAPGLVLGMRAAAPRLALVSVERVAAELRRLLTGEHVEAGLRLLRDGGALKAVLAEATTLDTGLAAVAACAEDVPTRLAALLAEQTPAAAASALRRLRLPRADVDAVAGLLALDPTGVARNASDLGDAAARHLALRAGGLLPRLLDLAAALGGREDAAAAGRLAHLGERLRDLDAGGALAGRRCPLDGRALTRILGIEPGPAVGAAQRRLLEAIAEGVIPADDAAAAEGWLAAGGWSPAARCDHMQDMGTAPQWRGWSAPAPPTSQETDPSA